MNRLPHTGSHCLPPTAYRLLNALRLVLPTAYRLLPTAYCLLLTACITPQPATPPPPRDSLVIRDREVPVYVSYPEVVYEFLDTTQCPPHLPDTAYLIRTKTVKLPPRIDTLLLPAQDSIIYRRDATVEKLLKEQLIDSDADTQRYQRRLGVMQVVSGALGFLLLLIGVALVVVWKSVERELEKEDEQ